MKSIIRKPKDLLFFLLSFGLPIISLAIAYFMIGLFPFGDKSILTIDLNSQYISFFSYIRNVLHGEAGLFYSFSNAIGGEMAGLNAYYLLSPLNVLFYFSEVNELPAYILLLTLVKIGLCGVTMFFYLREKQSRHTALLLAFCYALIGYNIVFQQNIMWLDGIVLLPLVVYGLDNILDRRQPWIYAVSLFAAICSNYYIGFMICLFSVLYFSVRFIEQYGRKNNAVLKSDVKRIFGRFVYGSLIAGGLSAFVIVPTLFAFQGGRAGLDLGDLSFGSMFTISDFLSKMYIGAYDYEQIQHGFPTIYTSLLMFPLVFIFFIAREIPFRKKVCYFSMLAILYMSLNITGINLFWHGLNTPNWFPHRFSFLFSFLLILISSQVLSRLEKKKIRIKKSDMFFIAFLFILQSIWIYLQDQDFLDAAKLLSSAIAVLFFCFLLFQWKKRPQNKVLWLFLSTAVFAEVTLNSMLTLQENDYASYEEYQLFVAENEPVIDQLLSKNEFYRIEKTYRYNQNDPLLLNYYGLSHYSSAGKVADKTFLGNLGYRDRTIWAIYSEGSSIPADSFLGVRYILTQDRELDYYSLKQVNGDINVYENEFALPLGFMTSEQVYTELEAYEDPLQYQNELYGLLGSTERIFERIPEDNIRVELENTTFQMVHSNLYRYGVEEESQDSYIHFYITNPERELINFYFNIVHFDHAEVYVDDVFIGEDFEEFSHTVNIAQSKNEEVKISLKLMSDQLRYYDALFYVQKDQVFEEAVSELKQDQLDIEEYRDGSIKGSVVSDQEKNVLLMTLPYNGSWEVRIDGQAAETEKVFDALTAIAVPEGNHEIELSFKPKGLMPGIFISSGTFFVFLIVYFKKRFGGR